MSEIILIGIVILSVINLFYIIFINLKVKKIENKKKNIKLIYKKFFHNIDKNGN